MRNIFLMVAIVLCTAIVGKNAVAIEIDDLEVTIRVIEPDREDRDDLSHKLELPDFREEKHEQLGGGDSREYRENETSRRDRDRDRHEHADYKDGVKEGYDDAKQDFDNAKEEQDESKRDLEEVKQDRDEAKEDLEESRESRDEAMDDREESKEDREETREDHEDTKEDSEER
jgi:hypothetical protein